MMRRDRVGPEQFAQMMGHALGHSARINEDQRCAMRLNQLRQTAINFLPDFIRHHRFQRRLRNLNRQVQFAAVTDVDDCAIRIATLVHGTSANQKLGNFLDRFLRRGQTDSLKRIFCQRGQTFDAQGKVRAAPVVHHRVDLVHNQCPHRAQHPPAGLGSEQQIQGFRRGDKNVRRLLDQGPALRRGGVARANFSAHVDLAALRFVQRCAYSSEWLLQIFSNVVAQRFERRDVNDLRFIGQFGLHAFAEQHVERSQKRRQRLARTRRCRNQRVPSGLDCRPATGLRFSRRAERLIEPPRDRGMKSKGLHEYQEPRMRNSLF